MKAEKIHIFDTTLRDGQQSPGAGMSITNNIEYAKIAALLGVDVLEAGFPSASEQDFQIVQTISQMLADEQSSLVISAACMIRESQIITSMKALESLVPFKRARVNCILPVAPKLMELSLGDYAKNKSKLLQDVYYMLSQATKAGYEVSLVAEAYSQSFDNFDFVTDLFLASAEAGVKVLVVADTVGVSCRYQAQNYITDMLNRHATIIRQRFPSMMWSIHCHNDFGLALDNTLSAVVDGPAREIQGCINGVGERAGNVALEQCIMVIEEFLKDKFYHTVNLNYLPIISDFVSQHMYKKSKNLPIVGANIARHTSGIHTNAILKEPGIYQAFDLTKIGTSLQLLFGPFSGGHHAKFIIESMGYRCSDQEKSTIAKEIKRIYSHRRKGITEDDLMKAYFSLRSPIKINRIKIINNKNAQSTVTLYGKFFQYTQLILMAQHEMGFIEAFRDEVERQFSNIQIIDYQSSQLVGKLGIKYITKMKISFDNHLIYQTKQTAKSKLGSIVKAYAAAVNQAYIDFHFKN